MICFYPSRKYQSREAKVIGVVVEVPLYDTEPMLLLRAVTSTELSLKVSKYKDSGEYIQYQFK